jgi:formiminotetrahydrofolate cyclodeaminase
MTDERTLATYIEMVSQPTPTPGAGSVAGIVGAMGCALAEMVCGITLSKQGDEPDLRIRESFDVVSTRRKELFLLAAQDEDAYGQYRTAQAMPRTNSEEQRARREAMAQHLERATDVPLRIAEASASALEELAVIAELGSLYALADISTAAYALEASTRGALENVWVNLRMTMDPERREELRLRADAALLRCSLATHSVTEIVSGRSGAKKDYAESDSTGQ